MREQDPQAAAAWTAEGGEAMKRYLNVLIQACGVLMVLYGIATIITKQVDVVSAGVTFMVFGVIMLLMKVNDEREEK